MEREKSVAEVYTYLAEHVEDSNVRETLKKLAEIEEGHYRRLKEIYDGILQPNINEALS